MQSLKETVQAYEAGSLLKVDFIKKMHGIHKSLFEYQERLTACNLSSIQILRCEVVAEFLDPNIRMICPPGDHRIAPVEALNFGAFEPAEIALVRRLVDQLGGNKVHIFDIGANAGFYSLALSKYFPGLRGVAFEPVPSTYSYLKRNLELNEVGEINALNLGLSDTEGDLAFAVEPEHSGASFIASEANGGNAHLVTCRVTTVDNYIAQGGKVPDFIKCDVEGAEFLVFKGACNLLKDFRPAIFTEILRKWAVKFNYHPNDLIHYLSELGYCCLVIRGEKLSPISTVTDDTMDTNYVFLHRQTHSKSLLAFC